MFTKTSLTLDLLVLSTSSNYRLWLSGGSIGPAFFKLSISHDLYSEISSSSGYCPYAIPMNPLIARILLSSITINSYLLYTNSFLYKWLSSLNKIKADFAFFISFSINSQHYNYCLFNLKSGFLPCCMS